MNLKFPRKTSLLAGWLACLLLSGCLNRDGGRDLEKAEKLVEIGNFSGAIESFDRILRRYKGGESAVRAAQRASRISVFRLKDYKRALKYYKYLVLYSPNEEERYDSQLQVARIYFEHLGDYSQAIIEYNRLLEVTEKKSDAIEFRKFIARGYFFLKNFFQAEVELESLARSALTKKDLYDVLFLQGNINMATKKTEDAIRVFSRLIDEFPVQAKADNVAIHLAICYEEKENFARAIEILDELKAEHKRPGFIDEKINRLKLRQSFLPGAKGLKK